MPEGSEGAPEGLTIGDDGMSDAQKSFVNTNFRAAVEAEYGEHAATADYADLNGLLKSHINQQKMIGADKIAKPTSKWGKDEWSNFNKEIGMPSDPNGYELEKFDSASDEETEWFKTFAHGELNLSNRQAQNLWSALQGRSNDKSAKFMELRKAKVGEGMETLKTEWGDKYDGNILATNEAMKKIDEDGRFRNWMKETGLNQEPEMLRFAAKVASSFTEDKVGSGGKPSIPMNPEIAKAKLNKIFSDAQKEGAKSPLMNRKDPSHDDVVREVTRLSDIAGGAR